MGFHLKKKNSWKNHDLGPPQCGQMREQSVTAKKKNNLKKKKNWRAKRAEGRTGKEERSASPFPFPRLSLGLLRLPNFLFRPLQFSFFTFFSQCSLWSQAIGKRARMYKTNIICVVGLSLNAEPEALWDLLPTPLWLNSLVDNYLKYWKCQMCKCFFFFSVGV